MRQYGKYPTIQKPSRQFNVSFAMYNTQVRIQDFARGGWRGAASEAKRCRCSEASYLRPVPWKLLGFQCSNMYSPIYMYLSFSFISLFLTSR